MSDFIYANLTLSYDGTNPTGYSPAIATINNNTPILDRPSDYVGSIALLNIDNFNAPLIIPLVLIDGVNTSANTLAYKFAMGFYAGGTYKYYESYVTYVPTIQGFVPKSGSVIATQDLTTTYYYVYEYQRMLNMFNTALSTILTQLKADPGAGAFADAPVPTFYFDPVRSVITLKASSMYFGKSPNAILAGTDLDVIQIYCNMVTTPLINGISQSTMDSFIVNNGTDTVTITNGTGCTNCILMYPTGANEDTASPPNYLIAQQSSEELCYWSTATSWQVTTNMPIAREYSSAPSGSQGIGQLPNQTQALLADFLADSADFVAYHTSLIYSQTNPLKMFNLISDTAMYRVDGSIQFTDGYGRIYPLLLSQGVTCTLKYLFIKKSVYTGITSARR